MRIKLLGVRVEICWEEEPDTATESLAEPAWVKDPAKEGHAARAKEYEGIVASATRTGMYL